MKQYDDTEFNNALKDIESNFGWKKKQKQDLKNQILTDIEKLETIKRNKNSIRFTNHKKVNLTGKLVYSCITLIILFGLISGTAFVSPAFANTLKSIPVIGSIFTIMGDKGLLEAEKSGLSISTNEEISVEDSSFKITDVIYDGSRLSIGYIITNFTNDNPLYSGNAVFKLNSVTFYGGRNNQGHYINKENYAGIYTLIVPNELKKNQIDLSITIKKFNGKEGNWDFNIPISMVEGKAFLVSNQVSSNDYTITMKKVTFTPATTELNFDLTEPINAEELNQIIRFRLYDDKGNELNEISAGGGGCDDCENIDGKITLDTSIQYEPIKNIPHHLIIEPYISGTNEKIKDLRMKILLKSEQ